MSASALRRKVKSSRDRNDNARWGYSRSVLSFRDSRHPAELAANSAATSVKDAIRSVQNFVLGSKIGARPKGAQ